MKVFYIITGIVIVLGIVGSFDFEDQQLEEQRYCEMVKAGAWPAYNPDINCKEVLK